MNETLKRALFGAVFILIVVSLIFWKPYGVYLLFISINAIGVFELHRMFYKDQEKPQLFFSLVSSFLVLALFTFPAFSIEDSILALLLFPLLAAVMVFKGKNSALRLMGLWALSLVYVTLPSILGILIGVQESNSALPVLLALLIMIWSNDTFAYLVGRQFGRHKLLERVSPKKTIEGFIGGLVFCILAGYLCSLSGAFSAKTGILLALNMGIMGTMGDLFESYLKRETGIKDSGKIIPGHGGILDRFDAFILALPVSFLILAYFS